MVRTSSTAIRCLVWGSLSAFRSFRGLGVLGVFGFRVWGSCQSFIVSGGTSKVYKGLPVLTAEWGETENILERLG